MHLILDTKAGSKTVIASSGQTFPEARYLHAVSIKYGLKTSKFFLQLNSLDFRINRSTCKTFLVKGNVLQPPPSPGDHVMPDYYKPTLGEPGCVQQAAAELGNTLLCLAAPSFPAGIKFIQEVQDWKRALKCKNLEEISKLRFLQQSSKYHEQFIVLHSVALSRTCPSDSEHQELVTD